MYIGSHTTICEDLLETCKNVKNIGGNFFQIFISEPRTGKLKKQDKKIIKKVNVFMKKNNIKMVFHSPYVLNFARPFYKEAWWIKSIIKELNYQTNFDHNIGSVIHMGKTNFSISGVEMKCKESDGFNNMFKSIKYILDETQKKSILILETSSGQGSELGYDLKKLFNFYDRFPKKYRKRIKFCIDTCHIFVAGYDIRNKKKVRKFFRVLKSMIPFEKIALIHLNDSAKKLESRVDRHDNLGKGFIGLEGIKEVVNIANKKNIPLLLETPVRLAEGKNIHKDEIKMIKKIINGEDVQITIDLKKIFWN